MSDADADIFAFDDGAYIDTLWFLPLPEGDLLACLYRTPDGVRRVRMRIRGYQSPDPFAGADHKEVDDRAVPLGIPNGELRASLQRTFERLREGSELRVVPVMGSPQDLFEALTQQPWAHFRPRFDA